MDILKVSLLKCTTASETLVMHRTTFLCLSLVLTSLGGKVIFTISKTPKNLDELDFF